MGEETEGSASRGADKRIEAAKEDPEKPANSVLPLGSDGGGCDQDRRHPSFCRDYQDVRECSAIGGVGAPMYLSNIVTTGNTYGLYPAIGGGTYVSFGNNRSAGNSTADGSATVPASRF